MKIVINTAYGGVFEETENKRLDPDFICDVESGRFVGHFDEHWGRAETLRVVEIPDDATDYLIVNYDGTEGIIYVLDGKLHLVPKDTDITRIIDGQ